MQGSPRIDELRQKFHENPRRYFAPLANEYRKAGDPEQAIAICRAHLAQQPGHMSGHVVYAQSLYDAARVDESRVVFEKALTLDPDNAIVLRYLGDISRQRGDSAEALHWYSRALEADPHDSEIAAYIAELTEPLTESTGEHAADAAAEPVIEKIAEPVAESHIEPDTAPTSLEPAPAADSEVAMPEPAKEPEVVAAAESPFVTRTMAELYASQGHRDAALEVYHQLAAANPDDAEIAGRIKELSSSDAPAEASTEQLTDESTEQLTEESTEQPTEASTEKPTEASTEKTAEVPVEPPIEEKADAAPIRGDGIPTLAPVEFADFAPADSEPAAAEPAPTNEYSEPTDLDADLTFRPETAEEPEHAPTESTADHFTESEIGEDHRWDADPWGENSSSEDLEITPFEFSPSDSSAADTGSTEAQSTEAHSILEPLAETEEPEADRETIEQHAPVDQSVEAFAIAEYGSTPLPLGVLNDAREEIAPEQMAASTQREPVSDETHRDEQHDDEQHDDDQHDDDQHDDESLVAYSPQTPDEDELAHYEPQGPTIREFFATLGAWRPPANGERESFTARAAVPGVEPIDDLPLASDAFSNLFADSPVSEDDSKAAFALSGAMGAQSQTPEVTKPRATPQSAAAPVQPAAPSEHPAIHAPAQESEEDIRRFREWLDGLADA